VSAFEQHSVLLRLTGVSLDLAGRSILSGISLDVHAGEFLGVIGPNGGGKTSLLRLMLGILRPISGRVDWRLTRDRQVAPGYVPQRSGTDPSCPFSTREIVRQGARGACPLVGLRRRRVLDRADELLDRVGLADRADAPFLQLSGGQQRRALLARALMNEPAALLLDEPTAGVDTEGQLQFCDLLREFSAQGMAIVLVSHDIPLVTAHAHRIACLAVHLHWHGAADHLDEETVRTTYRCELERYELRPHRHEPAGCVVQTTE
jgi:zinc transport system ATP-binding protein